MWFFEGAQEGVFWGERIAPFASVDEYKCPQVHGLPPLPWKTNDAECFKHRLKGEMVPMLSTSAFLQCDGQFVGHVVRNL